MPSSFTARHSTPRRYTMKFTRPHNLPVFLLLSLLTLCGCGKKEVSSISEIQEHYTKSKEEIWEILVNSDEPIACIIKNFEFEFGEDSNDVRYEENDRIEFNEACDEFVDFISEKLDVKPNTELERVEQLVPLAGAVQGASWPYGGRMYYLSLVHEDRELPIFLIVGVTDQ